MTLVVAEAENVRQEESHMLPDPDFDPSCVLTHGIELEGWCRDQKTGQLIKDLTTFLPEQRFDEGEIEMDAGAGCVEFISNVHTDPARVGADLEGLLRQLPSDWVVGFEPRNYHLSADPSACWNTKPRYEAMKQALMREKPGDWHHLNQIVQWAALHVTMDCDPLSVEGVNLMNFLNLIGPYLVYHVCEENHIDNYGHHQVWTRFADPRRLPEYRWFSGPAEFVRFFTSIPKLVKPLGGGRYAPDLEHPQEVAEREDESNFWLFARPKASYRKGACPGAIEFRPLPSMPPPLVVKMCGLIPSLSQRFLELTLGQQMTDVGQLLPTLGEIRKDPRFSPFVPEEPPSRAAWTTYFNL